MTNLSGVRASADDEAKPEIEPDSWRDLTEFVDQFSDVAVFGVLADPDDNPEGSWIVKGISKVRPSAVPIDQPPTFDMDVLGPDGKVVDETRLTIDEVRGVSLGVQSGATRLRIDSVDPVFIESDHILSIMIETEQDRTPEEQRVLDEMAKRRDKEFADEHAELILAQARKVGEL